MKCILKVERGEYGAGAIYINDADVIRVEPKEKIVEVRTVQNPRCSTPEDVQEVRVEGSKFWDVVDKNYVLVKGSLDGLISGKVKEVWVTPIVAFARGGEFGPRHLCTIYCNTRAWLIGTDCAVLDRIA